MEENYKNKKSKYNLLNKMFCKLESTIKHRLKCTNYP